MAANRRRKYAESQLQNGDGHINAGLREPLGSLLIHISMRSRSTVSGAPRAPWGRADQPTARRGVAKAD